MEDDVVAEEKQTFSQALYMIQREHPQMSVNRIVRHLAIMYPHSMIRIQEFVDGRFISYAKKIES